MTTDLSVLQWIIQGGFAALFIWLLFDTRRDARQREDIARKDAFAREERLIIIVDGQRDSLDVLAEAFRDISEKMPTHTTLELYKHLAARVDDLTNAALSVPEVKK